jgi:hypothetical protein
VNIYAPTDTARREQFFQYLLGLQVRHRGPVLVGGDFNCTLHPLMDRSNHRSTAVRTSEALQRLLANWNLVDALQRELEDTNDPRHRADFHRDYHTYNYRLAIDARKSSRLDR